MKRRPGRPIAALAALLLAGCISVGVGTGDAPGLTYYVLDDARPAAGRPAAGATESLAVQGLGADPLTDSTSMLYSRRAGERSLYQLAAWTERPTRRLVQLAQQRLEARGAFAVVTQLGQPLSSDWLLTLTIEEMFHDVGNTPGHARLAVRAELTDRRQRGKISSARFAAAPVVAEANAATAARAFGEATAEVLDQLAAWVEAAAQTGKAK